MGSQQVALAWAGGVGQGLLSVQHSSTCSGSLMGGCICVTVLAACQAVTCCVVSLASLLCRVYDTLPGHGQQSAVPCAWQPARPCTVSTKGRGHPKALSGSVRCAYTERRECRGFTDQASPTASSHLSTGFREAVMRGFLAVHSLES